MGLYGHKTLAEYAVDDIVFFKYNGQWWPVKVTGFTSDGFMQMGYFHDKHR